MLSEVGGSQNTVVDHTVDSPFKYLGELEDGKY